MEAEASADAQRSAMLAGLIRVEMDRAGGAVPFARFMELALYAPDLGYYENATVGRKGDFYTSVSVGPLFGELMALQGVSWLEEVERPVWVEAGAHDGRFAADFLGWMRTKAPSLHARMRYRIVEPSVRRRAWQQQTLKEHGEIVEWSDSVEPFSGVLFGNELLDAFPVERFGWERTTGTWFRWGVQAVGSGFAWCRLPVGPIEGTPVDGLPAELLEVLPDGYTVECSPLAEQWWRNAATALQRGRMVTLDYGYEAAERFRPERTRGTLRGFRAHRFVDDVLADPGCVDLTAHVDFGRIAEIGERAGLATELLETQRRFLTGIMAQTLKAGAGVDFGEWTPSRVRQFQTLTHPQHLGHSFRVLVQKRE
jgi:SAM-dependent MidA family methyltransferase